MHFHADSIKRSPTITTTGATADSASRLLILSGEAVRKTYSCTCEDGERVVNKHKKPSTTK